MIESTTVENPKGGSWTVKSGPWSIPEGHEQRAEIETTGYGWNVVTGVRALAMAIDYRTAPEHVSWAATEGEVFGMRALSNPKESGYQMEGSVSIGGVKYRALTSSALFEREDGTLCDVATLHVSNYFPRPEVNNQ